MDGWEGVLQDGVKNWMSAFTAAKYSQPFELQKAQLQALGQYAPLQTGQQIGGINSGTLLLMAGVVVVVFAMAD
ncbi:MAG TPA: hypothetical protein VFF03_15010 [Rhodocyclaceae bacterium]|nr:hypothetical protein [Rhodocyclaceae bacterium]